MANCVWVLQRMDPKWCLCPLDMSIDRSLDIYIYISDIFFGNDLSTSGDITYFANICPTSSTFVDIIHLLLGMSFLVPSPQKQDEMSGPTEHSGDVRFCWVNYCITTSRRDLTIDDG